MPPTDLGPAGLSGLYRDMGQAWHWNDRDAWDQIRMQEYLLRADTHIYAAVDESADIPSRDAGLLELVQHDDGSVEIVYLGLMPAWIGRGLGGWLVEQVVRSAFALGASRVWLHTCTLDAPAALPNYLARGFTVERSETYHVTRSTSDTNPGRGSAAA